MFTPIQQEYIKELERYVTTEDTFDIKSLIINLINEFPNFYYEGIGFRGIRGQWDRAQDFNFSWSLDFESAVEACESFVDLKGNIFVYEANVKGFDLDLFVRDCLRQKVEFSPNFLSFALKEKEILVISHGPVRLVEEINKIF